MLMNIALIVCFLVGVLANENPEETRKDHPSTDPEDINFYLWTRANPVDEDLIVY